MSKAHDLQEKERTKDILIDEQFNFKTLLLSEPILKGLEKHGFHKPSPIQLKAIPIGKCGFDLIVKSKSGTGKTLVFGLIALEAINLNKKHVQVLILAPTREIAVQIQNVIKDLGSEFNGLNVECFIGGLPFDDDLKKAQKCHIAVGAPGRVRHLIQSGALNVKHVKLFVLDEVDKLMVQNGRVDVEEIASKLPSWKQTIAVSATLSGETEGYLDQFMSSPTLVEPTTDSPLLLGIRQFVDVVKTNLNIVHQLDIKSKELIRLLSQISFTQCLVFTNYQTRAASVCNHLNRNGWNSMYISADQKQTERLQVIESLRNGKCKILMSTDLTARGIDASHVDLTINYDVPYEASTYLHRMGRAGRYGTKGLCITISTEEELTGLKKILGSIAGGNFLIPRLPRNTDLPADLINLDTSTLQFEQSVVDLVKIPQESRNIISSLVDMKSSKISKKTNKHPKNNPKTKEDSDSKETSELQLKTPLSDVQSKIDSICFSTTTVSDVTLDIESPELKELLTMLETSATPSNSSNVEINTEFSDSTKKRKRDGKSPSKSRDSIYQKNVAMLHVAELLTRPNLTEVTDETKEVMSQFMDTLKENNSLELSKDQGDIYADLHESQDSLPHSEELGIDNIFKLSYDYAVVPGAPNWVEMLGIDLEEKVVLDELEPKEVLSLNRSPKKRYKSSKHRKNLERTRKTSNNTYDTNPTKSIHLNASFPNDSYSDTHSEMLLNNSGNLTCQKIAQNVEQAIKSPIPSHFQAIGNCNSSGQFDHEYSGNQHFNDCFQRYSDELTEKLQTFEDMPSFENWYKQWQWQVQSVREYVQQNIYIQEMNKYMYGHT